MTVGRERRHGGDSRVREPVCRPAGHSRSHSSLKFAILMVIPTLFCPIEVISTARLVPPPMARARWRVAAPGYRGAAFPAPRRARPGSGSGWGTGWRWHSAVIAVARVIKAHDNIPTRGALHHHRVGAPSTSTTDCIMMLWRAAAFRMFRQRSKTAHSHTGTHSQTRTRSALAARTTGPQPPSSS